MNTKTLTQTSFLDDLISNATTVNMFLANGIKLVGTVVSQDKYVIFLKDQRTVQMVYKSKISTVVPCY